MNASTETAALRGRWQKCERCQGVRQAHVRRLSEGQRLPVDSSLKCFTAILTSASGADSGPAPVYRRGRLTLKHHSHSTESVRILLKIPLKRFSPGDGGTLAVN